ncbi:TauD/TfdA family dioxygenase [Bradyrhizobium sp. 183]|uniref:TauD/TfdA dioxygenase family protein n=1 Tax=unclassified Bradyrhizobium TaxID=2631580 RepID=UPI001FFF8761|nr:MULTISPECIES: TauD/TfdA family dioxygenase [unclassified Bradyrhizobium]UPJ79273.1 TauD/TfdA family dioxygenase [Bradyrhizobium sp. 184]UPJ87066.1 TauD/TfdA family dioxygenase [Bradyrhizobium sp. 183]
MQNVKINEALIPQANIIRCAPRLGAEIVGFRLSAEISQDILCAIRQLLREHHAIFFRDQEHLDDVEYGRLLERLGNVGSEAVHSDDHRPARNDHRFSPGLSILRSVAIAPGRPETAWSNMRAAYLELPLPLRKLTDDLWVVCEDGSAETAGSGVAQENTMPAGEWPVVDHPVVGIHPETGERILALGNFPGRFVGLQKDTSQKLFHLLHSYIAAPENAVLWSWKDGDIALWDNHTAQHYSIDDHQKDAIRPDKLTRELWPSVNRHRRAQRRTTPKPEEARAA